MIEPISYGWQCPICKRVYNPRQEMCLYCGGGSISTPSTPSPVKKFQQGGEISWDTICKYCDTLNTSIQAINNTDTWTSVSSSIDSTINANDVSNSISINGVELKDMIENSVKEKLNETTVRANL